ncbi:MAG: hypothetical protein WCF67_02425 [Chitinophagaceae bacterium]
MKKLLICLAFAATTIGISANAQQTKTTAPTASNSSTVYAYANGDDSYLQFSADTYKADKKYVVFKLWSEKSPLTETERANITDLKKALAGKNVEVVEFEWKNEEQLKEMMAKYGIKAKVSDDKHINLKSEHLNLNTTSGKALFVMEDDKPVSVCSGKDCEDRLKFFFKLKVRV